MVNRTMHYLLVSTLISSLIGCQTSKKAMDPSRKFPAETLRKDYTLLREVMERFHPALYWYTPKDSMDYYFDHYYNAITDSMTRQEFGFSILAPLTTKVRCGHTSFNYPKKYNKKKTEHVQPSFPLFMKMWGDTMVITSNLNRNDSILTKGTLVTRVNGLDIQQLTDTLFQFMPTDGYAENVNYVRLSAAFPYYHRNILGLSDTYEVTYADSMGVEKTHRIPLFDPATDSLAKTFIRNKNKQIDPADKPEKLENYRSLKIDPTGALAVMTIHSFGGRGQLHAFYRKSFRKMHKEKISNLVIDLRTNGGGRVNNYTSLARYITDSVFKVADTVSATNNKLGKYKRYFSWGKLNSMVLFFTTSKRQDNYYHFRYWENHEFRPRKRNHYNGKVFVLINGPTFSASTLFAHTVRRQSNVLLVGEEAGGGAYGNSGILIPDVVLPETKMKVRIPLFRLVQYHHPPKDGRGVVPDIYVPPTVENIRNGKDGKMEKVKELINHSSLIE